MTIGLTGGVAAGKSEALSAFGRLGAATISADAIVHDLLDRQPMMDRLRDRWGEEIAPAGRVDRAMVGNRVFSDPEELAWLEQQVHPLVRDELTDWIGSIGPEVRYAVAEVPLLFEGTMADRFDHTVAIIAGEEIRLERAKARGQAGIEGREDRQLSQAEKAERADFVILNDGTPADLERKLAGLLDRLTAGLSTDGAG